MSRRILYQDRYMYYLHECCEISSTHAPRTRMYEALQIFYNIRGNKQVLIEGNRYVLHPGDIFIIDELESFCIYEEASAPSEYMQLIFSQYVLRHLDAEFQLIKKFKNRKLGEANLIYASERFHQLIRGCMQHVRHIPDDFNRRASIFGMLIILLNEINISTVYRAPDEAAQNLEIIQYVNEHITEDLTVDLLAQKYYMSASQFYRLFRKLTGTTLVNYITGKRVILARNLIRNNVKVKDAVALAGFKEYTTFYKANMKYFKKPPSSEHPTEENDPLLLRGFYQI